MKHEFDLNVEDMPREVLIANYFDAVGVAEALRNFPNQRVPKIKDCLKLKTGPSLVLNMLLTGKTYTREQILTGLGSYETAQSNMVRVYISLIRSCLKPHGVEIDTIHNFGYRIKESEIEKINALIFGENTDPARKLQNAFKPVSILKN